MVGNKSRGRVSKRYQRDFTHYFKEHKVNEKKPKKQKALRGTVIYVDSDRWTWDLGAMRPPSKGYLKQTGPFTWQWVFKDEEEIKQEPLTEEQEKLNQSIMQLKQVLGRKFINIDEVAEILEIGFVSNKNVFLYGRGGHAKSEIIQEFLKHIDPSGENSFVQACGEGLSEEKLFGGLNLKKFQQTGEIEYLVENSFMNKRFVVFEELLDSRMNVLLSLKDILTSGIFRQGKQQFKIKTEFVVCLTNRTKQEVAEDNSIKALLERFPLEMKVEWGKYEADDYRNMFSKVLGDSLEKVATICQSINESGDFVSPRTAIHMGQVFKKTGSLGALKYFGATRDIIEKVEKLEKERSQSVYISNKAKEYEQILGRHDCSCIDGYKQGMKEVRGLLAEISNTTYVDKVFPTFNSLKGKIEAKIEEYKAGMLNIIENE